MSALDTQVGGDHYRAGSIQPIQYIEANSLQFLEASVVKRVTRHNRPTGKGRQDIEKAIHELQLLLELRYAEPVDEGWIEHDGGTRCPVNPGVLLDICYSDGDKAFGIPALTRTDILSERGNHCGATVWEKVGTDWITHWRLHVPT